MKLALLDAHVRQDSGEQDGASRLLDEVLGLLYKLAADHEALTKQM